MTSMQWMLVPMLLLATTRPIAFYPATPGLRSSVQEEDDIYGKDAPDFELRTASGSSIRLSELRAKVVLLSFWATWCEPCIVEMPLLAKLQKKYGSKGLQIIAITDGSEDPAQLKELSTKFQVGFPLVHGNESVAASYGGIDILPTAFLISKEGKIVDRILGAQSPAVIESKIKGALENRKVNSAN